MKREFGVPHIPGEDLCPKCGKQIESDDFLTCDGDDVFYHIDCENPKKKFW